MDNPTKKSKKKTAKADELSFEEALARLEEIVEELEGGETTLEQSLSLFREGMGLKEQCQKKLDQTEAAIKQLVAAGDGDAEESELTLEAEE